jgi:hypothetical protein
MGFDHGLIKDRTSSDIEGDTVCICACRASIFCMKLPRKLEGTAVGFGKESAGKERAKLHCRNSTYLTYLQPYFCAPCVEFEIYAIASGGAVPQHTFND